MSKRLLCLLLGHRMDAYPYDPVVPVVQCLRCGRKVVLV